ncbi:hypothetical protein ABT061_25535 [Streptosporangium sp. NPDC002544]|uniref:hypothetical protein n=1 Tax=Streptosporangium sp. NPDC002544 TaxID=3154538 RepID=UPI00332B67E4
MPRAKKPTKPLVHTRKTPTRRQARALARQRREQADWRLVEKRDRAESFKPYAGHYYVGRNQVLFLSFLPWILVVAIVTNALPDLKVALGVTGTPGTATVVVHERVGRNSYHSEARLVFDDPAREPVIVKTVSGVELGESFRAALTPEGDWVLPTGMRGATRSLMFLSMAPLCLSFIPYVLLYRFRVRRGLKAAAVGGGVVAAASVLMFVVMLVLNLFY